MAKAISDRLAETRMTQMDVASKAGVSLTTLRELQHNINARKRQPRTLAAISEALGWPSPYLERVLHGETLEPHAEEAEDPVLRKLDAVLDELQELRDRVAALEKQRADEAERP
ncbi:XRE family transcriptional regulator [Saccharopolyspora sp. K220]|uniref:XRE family transcriptional regulator n=1 Tax=Saccharopolyspora soli TaxID=2926618 RepID=UPI001F59860F|nr:XRE family transcriptional regulator [Saccharopolyspora soli]MCI2421529.1 XRE family transcriptional regulator [Saccharopolyspora soli]